MAAARTNEFTGFTEEMYQFFWEIAFNNHESFYQQNKERYREWVQLPMRALAARLIPTALTIDPDFSTNLNTIVSRIRRDTRYTKDISPFRDHAWLSFRHPGRYLSECFVLYAEFERDHYGYGMGMYGPNPALMNPMRQRMLDEPELFLELVHDPALTSVFEPDGESFKRGRYLDADERLRPWLNRKSLSFSFRCPQLSKTMRPEIADEIIAGFAALKPLYQFLVL